MDQTMAALLIRNVFFLKRMNDLLEHGNRLFSQKLFGSSFIINDLPGEVKLGKVCHLHQRLNPLASIKGRTSCARSSTLAFLIYWELSQSSFPGLIAAADFPTASRLNFSINSPFVNSS